MKGVKVLALVLIFTLMFGTPSFAAASDHSVIKWGRVEYYDWDDELYSVSITINGAVGKQVEDGIVESPVVYRAFLLICIMVRKYGRMKT
ncbi:hypothetical protein ODU73_002375 [Thermoclostridium stercorarium]|uniref:hypothetical protein n=1 Tax=Thermoclostridium stercorarium TaxID=1510 RepID=UPI0022491886|nr:hypothetical protein [Thermoclostridium stercorarium]UZQ85255.1 hypothetical protein ODU73_002375 [Thermoclostridium stercorarium]